MFIADKLTTIEEYINIVVTVKPTPQRKKAVL